MFLPQAEGAYVLIAWRFHPKSEAARSAVCEQGGYICGTWNCAWPYTKQTSGYCTVGNQVSSARETHVAAGKDRLLLTLPKIKPSHRLKY